MISVLLADDEELIRAGLCRIIDSQPDMAVVGQVGDGDAAIAAVARHSPDIVLMDVRMPRLDGLHAAELLLSQRSCSQVIVLTTFDLDDYVYRALRIGAAGFLLKRTTSDELLRAIRVVAAGDAIIDPSVTRRLVATFVQPEVEPVDLAEEYGLTDREISVLAEMATGASNAAIGRRLGVSTHTVKSHVSHVLAKIGCTTRVQAVVFAFDCGLAMPHPEDSAGVNSRRSNGR